MRKEYKVKALNYDKEMDATIFVDVEGGCLHWHGYGRTDVIWGEKDIFETNLGRMKMIEVNKSSYQYEIEGKGEFKGELLWCD